MINILLFLVGFLLGAFAYRIFYFREKIKTMDISSIGNLIDKLTIENIRIWHNCDMVASSKDSRIVSDYAKKNIIANNRRNKLIQSIDDFIEEIYFKDNFTKYKSDKQGDTKDYGKRA